MHSRQLDLTAVEVTTNPRLSLAGAIDKLLRQAQRQQVEAPGAQGRGRRRGRRPPAGSAEGERAARPG